VKDGMVVHTRSQRVKVAQQSVVEFLLINHPLDCPVCDKGGECPLQDITFGWGPGISRYIEPKRHFVKPLELSPLVAIDRERCILCYRCVRFSQEVAEDEQLVLAERGAHTYVATFDGHPYVAPFSGNIIELCPVGALTSRPYRFRARPRAARAPTRRGCCWRASCARAWAPRTSTRGVPAASSSSSCVRWASRHCRRIPATWSSPTRCSCSTPSRCTTRRSSTCACARACAATGR